MIHGTIHRFFLKLDLNGNLILKLTFEVNPRTDLEAFRRGLASSGGLKRDFFESH